MRTIIAFLLATLFMTTRPSIANAGDKIKQAVFEDEEEASPAPEPASAPKPRPQQNPKKRQPVLTTPQRPRAGAGVMNIRYAPPGDKQLQELVDALRESNVLEELTKNVTESVKLPKDLPVDFRDCGDENAFYDPNTSRITMCYELVRKFAVIFGQDEERSEEEMGMAIIGATTFFLLHEFGHALVDLLDLPVTGKEEDAVDELAALTLIEVGQENADQLLGGVVDSFDAFATEAEEMDVDYDFADEHSLDEQRLYQVMCYLYGSDPTSYPELVGEDGLSEERAARCPAEFEQKKKSWDRLLEPYFKS